MEMVASKGANTLLPLFGPGSEKNVPVLWSNSSKLPEGRVPEEIQKNFGTIKSYIEEFLPSEHPFRKGSVCPFVKIALKNSQIFYSYLTHFDLEQNLKFISNCILELNERRKQEGFSAVCILLPSDFNIRDLLILQREAKLLCVRSQMMVGAIYKTNQSPSLHNSSYYPLRTQTPILVLRDIHLHDLIFLDPKHYSLRDRRAFLQTYINRFKKHRTGKAAANISKAKRLLIKYCLLVLGRYAISLGALMILLLMLSRYFHAI